MTTIFKESNDTTIYDAVVTFLYKSFLPVRITFPSSINVNYKNDIFKCTSYEDHISFKLLHIETPAMYMVKILNKLSTDFELEQKDDKYILDTKGKIPTRYVYMLKDFYFKDNAVIDYESKVNNTEKYWRSIVSRCPRTLLELCIEGSFYSTQNKYKIKVLHGPSHFKDRTWYTKNGDLSKAAEKFMNKSKTLYSLGNIDQNAEIKFGYDKLFVVEGGINMDYAKNLPWYSIMLPHIRFEFTYWSGLQFRFDRSAISSYVHLHTRGHDTYDQRGNLSTEEIVVLYEFLKSEGADVQVINTNLMMSDNKDMYSRL